MMWFVRLALIRPYTFIVMAILIVLVGIFSITKMSTDIFPEIDIPVVSLVWTYTGMPASDMEKRIVTISERSMTTTVNDIEHIESQSMNGVSVIKVFFHPGARIEAAVAQVTAVSQTVLKVLPPGITPPFIIRYNASSVPIIQIGVSSKTLSEQSLYDFGLNFVRTQLATVQGASIPLPYGGKARQIMVDINPEALYAKGLSPVDVVNAVNAQNLILPAGTMKSGGREYQVEMNSSPDIIDQLNEYPVRQVDGATIFIKDVAQVRDGAAVQTNIVRQNGRRASLLTVLKASGASTLDVVKRLKEALPGVKSTLPKELNLDFLSDQSLFVKAAIDGVVREALIASCLTGAMILLFLGSWRSTVIVMISIPLSILCSIICLSLCGQTLNVMTLGGLALAIGMLVDDATVEIENIHRNQHLTPSLSLSEIILIGAEQVSTPALVSTLSICIVFFPVVLITGAAKSLFIPMAMAVVFAMMASYVLSRTLVPVLALYLIPHHSNQNEAPQRKSPILLQICLSFWHQFENAFERFRTLYHQELGWGLRHRKVIVGFFSLFFASSLFLLPWIGQDFFPSVDAGQIRLHVRTPLGTRIEETERRFSQVEQVIRDIIPTGEIENMIDNIGLPASGINLAFGDSATIGVSDGEILVSLNEHHHSTAAYIRTLRQTLAQRFPDTIFFFQSADIISQILNFGLPSPIDIQVIGRDKKSNYKIAQEIVARVSKIPGLVDVHLHQASNSPKLMVNIDRLRAMQLGLTQRDVANNILVSLSSSSQVTPNYWINPQNGVNYLVAVQTPQHVIHSINDLQSTPLFPQNMPIPQLLSNVANVSHQNTTDVVNHYNVQPAFDIYANVQNSDLGTAAQEIEKVLSSLNPKLSHGSKLVIRGQVESMRTSFASLGLGLIMAIILVYLLMVINFQSWIDPLIIMTCLPATLAGILWSLYVTGTSFNVPSLMGTIMSIGVATANSILMISFANEQREAGFNATNAALSAGFTRLRPVIMTAIAMIVGMLPMALGLGEGGEQNAPLGRAVIGGLLAATFATLLFVPVVYTLMRKEYKKNSLTISTEKESLS